MMIGWLQKKGDRGPVKLWKQRYFIEITNPDSVLYFEKNPGPPESNGQYSKEGYLGEILLDRVVNVSSVPTDPTCFDVWSLHGRTYKLKAPTVQEKVLWMNVFNKKLVQDREDKELNTKNVVLNGRHTIQTVTESPKPPSLAKSPSHEPARKTVSPEAKEDNINKAASPSKRKSEQQESKRTTQLDDLEIEPQPSVSPVDNSDAGEDESRNKDMKRGRNRAMSMSELDVEIELQETKPDVELQEFTPAKRPHSKIVRMDSYTQIEVSGSPNAQKPAKSPSNDNTLHVPDFIPKRKNSSFLRRTLPPELASAASREIEEELQKERTTKKKGQRKSMNLESLDIDPPTPVSTSLLDDVSHSKSLRHTPLKSSLKSAFTGSYQGKGATKSKKPQISFKPSPEKDKPTKSLQSSKSVGHLPKFKEIVNNGNTTIVKRTTDLPELDQEAPSYAAVGPSDANLDLDERIALRLIQMALLTHAKSFQLENTYWEFKQLRAKLKTVPKQIVQLKEITSLSIVGAEGVEFASFPEEINQLTNLVFFRCVNGQLTQFPSVCELTQLSHLELSGHSFSEIPSGISKLTNLKVLKINGCKNLASLPTEIGSLENLEELDLHDCALTSVPDSIQNLTKLRILNLSNNQLKQPPVLSRGLDELHLSNNRITDIPASLVSLEFKQINIANNPLLPELRIRADNWKRLASYILSRADDIPVNLVNLCIQAIKKNKNQILMAYVVNTEDKPNTLIALLGLEKTDNLASS